MSSEYSEEIVDENFDSEDFSDEDLNEPDLPIWDEDGKIHLTRTTKKGG